MIRLDSAEQLRLGGECLAPHLDVEASPVSQAREAANGLETLLSSSSNKLPDLPGGR